MALPNNSEEIPLIEEQVETGLKALLESYQPNYIPGGEKKDELIARFTLYPGKALPELDNPFAKAYEAYDDFNPSRPVYALVNDPSMPVRTHAITEMTAIAHPNITPLLGAGVVNCSHLGESRHVMFFERPKGVPALEGINKQVRLHEHKVIDFIIQPALKGLLAMYEKKVSHGHIHPANFYISDASQLGECYSSPCSTQNHYLYEPIERLMADPLGRGDATEKSDVYAIAILAYELMFGLEKIKALPKEVYIERIITTGSYAVYSANRDFSDTFQDFFRGILNDNPSERWGLEELQQWVNGKRFNMIAPQPPKEGSRPLLFANEEFLSRNMIAYAFHTHWRQALKEVKNLKIDRWVETSLHRPELAEKLERCLRLAGNGSTDAQLNDMLTRIITLLDPAGPIRSHALSLRPDGIGVVLADVVKHQGDELPQLLSFIENDLGNFWTEQNEANKTPEMSQVVFKLKKVKPYLKNNAYGFGLERVLYDLNPSLCCQSPLIKQYHVTTSLDTLKTLDAIASKVAHDTSLADRHIAAFIASKVDIGKDIRINEIDGMPELAGNPELIILKMLAKAQQKHKKLLLVGLCGWAAMRVEKLIDTIHNRIIRKRLKMQLKRLALTGDLFEVLGAIVNTDVTRSDTDGFTKAIALHQFNYERIEMLRNESILEYKSKKAGGKMAMSISYTVLLIVSYITLTDMFGI